MEMDLTHLQDISGLQFMPVRLNKQPIVKGWQTSTERHNLSNCEAVGLVCGTPSGGIEVIDVDEKYSLDGKLFERYKTAIHLADKNLLKKLVVQKTKSGGYHLIYRCQKISGNLKLANRPTTDEEKKFTYEETYKAELAASKTDEDARKKAQKASDNDKVRVLLETRGEGGYVMCTPTEGYELVHGDYYSISEINEEERETLLNTARQFNEVVEEVYVPQKKSLAKIQGLTPFDDYNQRGDVVGLLEGHGWRVVGRKGAKTIFLRPGQTSAQSSGNYDSDRNWFSVFTTSTEFEPTKAYRPCYVFALLECNGDFTAAAKKLAELGYGEKLEAKPERESTRKIQSRVEVDNEDYSCFAVPNDYDEYLRQVRSGNLQMGLTTGIPSLDEHFLFKHGNLVMNNGIDNTGKSVVSWYLSLLAAMYHGWKGIIFSAENTIGSFMRKMIQFYWGQPLANLSQQDFDDAKAFIEKHFLLIKAEEELYNYKDIINMVKKANKRMKYDYAMIDPYNALKIDLSGFSKLNTHEYHYEAISEIKAFGQKNDFGWVVNLHAVTSAARAKDGDRKYPLAPRKEDTEGGQKFPNKADDFFTTHRLVSHPTDWMVTEIHVRKIKDTETGGRPTTLDSPVKLEMYAKGCAFRERNELSAFQVDPIESWHKAKGTLRDKPQTKTITYQPSMDWEKRNAHLPYKDDAGTEIGF